MDESNFIKKQEDVEDLAYLDEIPEEDDTTADPSPFVPTVYVNADLFLFRDTVNCDCGAEACKGLKAEDVLTADVTIAGKETVHVKIKKGSKPCYDKVMGQF